MAETESDPIVVNVTPMFSDFLWLNLRLVARSLQMRLLIVLSLFWLGAYLSLLLIAPAEQRTVANVLKTLPALFLPAFTFLLMPMLIYQAVKRRWRDAPEVRESKTYTFTDSGMHVAAATSEAFLMWSIIATAQRVGRWAVLNTGQQQCHAIPVEAFDTAENWERFCRLVEANVSGSRLS